MKILSRLRRCAINQLAQGQVFEVSYSGIRSLCPVFFFCIVRVCVVVTLGKHECLTAHLLEDEGDVGVAHVQSAAQVLDCRWHLLTKDLYNAEAKPLFELERTSTFCAQTSLVDVEHKSEVADGLLQVFLEFSGRRKTLSLRCVLCLPAQQDLREQVVNGDLVEDK